MEFDYKSITPESKRLLINGHQNKEMAQILDSIIANGITLLPDNRDGDIENICGHFQTRKIYLFLKILDFFPGKSNL